MIPSWPQDLPRPMREGFMQSFGEARFRRGSDVGPPGYRRRFSAVADMVSLVIDVSRDGRARFERFWNEDCSLGSLPFAMPDPATDGWELLTVDGSLLTTETGEPILLSATWLCLFSDERPAFTAIGIRWRIAFGVSVMP